MKIINIVNAINENYNLKFIIIFIDYFYIDANDYNEVFVVHDVGLMIIMMITIMHESHSRSYHYHNNYHNYHHHHLLLF